MGLPASYKMEVKYSHEENLVHAGTKADPVSFHPSADDNNGVLVLGTNEAFKSSDGLCFRFSVVTPGVYRFYARSVDADPKIMNLYKYNDDGTLPNVNYTGFSSNDDYSSSTYPDAPNYCTYKWDYYIEVSLEAGDYAMVVKCSSSKNVTIHVELKDGAAPVYPEGPSDLVTVVDSYELSRVEGVGYYSLVKKNGVLLKDGKAYGYSLNEREHEYQLSNREIAGFDLASTSLANFASAGVASYVKTEEGKDYFTVSSASGFGHDVVDLLGFDPELAGDFEITADSTTGAIASIKLAVGEAVCDVSVTEISELPITVADYPVGDDGEYDGGGAVQDW